MKMFITRKNEKHLTQSGLKKKDYYSIYKEEIEGRAGSLPPVSRGRFTELWDARFPHIKLPKYTAVQTKCQTCSLLDVYAEEHCHTKQQRAELRDLRKYHASMYRKQRLWYHKVREKAMKEPEDNMSCIGDGMAQIHNALPSYSKSGTQTAPMTFDTHFQGMITHGKRFTIFRSFGNVGKGTNVAVYAWLRHLEIEYRENNNKLPDTLFFQVDGGGENANEILVGVSELLIHWGLTKKIVLTRLPVGHTHEDIDGKFGTIWQHNKMFNILTPQKQAELTVRAFSEQIKKGFKVGVEDVFVVPDYRKYIRPYSWLTRVFKTTYEKPYTQLQFIIESVNISEEFPLGARTMYRAFPTDSAIDIIPKSTVPFIVPPSTTIDLMALRIDAITRPTSDDNNGGPAGARVLNCFPKEPLQVAPYKEIKVKESSKTVLVNAKRYLARMVNAMEDSVGADTKTAREWREFAAEFPQTETAEEYIKTPGNRYHVPFAEFFNRSPETSHTVTSVPTTQSIRRYDEDKLVHADATAIAKWGIQGRGFSNFGMKTVTHPREFPNFAEQGLSGPYLLPREKKTLPPLHQKPLKYVTYNGWNKDKLKIELEKRQHLDQNGTNKEMARRLREDDEKLRNPVASSSGGGGGGVSSSSGDVGMSSNSGGGVSSSSGSGVSSRIGGGGVSSGSNDVGVSSSSGGGVSSSSGGGVSSSSGGGVSSSSGGGVSSSSGGVGVSSGRGCGLSSSSGSGGVSGCISDGVSNGSCVDDDNGGDDSDDNDSDDESSHCPTVRSSNSESEMKKNEKQIDINDSENSTDDNESEDGSETT